MTKIKNSVGKGWIVKTVVQNGSVLLGSLRGITQ